MPNQTKKYATCSTQTKAVHPLPLAAAVCETSEHLPQDSESRQEDGCREDQVQKDVSEEQQITEKSSTPSVSTNWADEVDATIFTQQLS
jgi:hypothetical protein